MGQGIGAQVLSVRRERDSPVSLAERRAWNSRSSHSRSFVRRESLRSNRRRDARRKGLVAGSLWRLSKSSSALGHDRRERNRVRVPRTLSRGILSDIRAGVLSRTPGNSMSGSVQTSRTEHIRLQDPMLSWPTTRPTASCSCSGARAIPAARSMTHGPCDRIPPTRTDSRVTLCGQRRRRRQGPFLVIQSHDPLGP